jgi:hypothetical protein
LIVRRVKKQIPTQTQPGDQVEIITRPDGTKVRRIRRAKKPESSNSTASGNSANSSSLDSHLRSTASTSRGSASVAGDMVEGQIYIRADGKKYVKTVVLCFMLFDRRNFLTNISAFSSMI